MLCVYFMHLFVTNCTQPLHTQSLYTRGHEWESIGSGLVVRPVEVWALVPPDRCRNPATQGDNPSFRVREPKWDIIRPELDKDMEMRSPYNGGTLGTFGRWEQLEPTRNIHHFCRRPLPWKWTSSRCPWVIVHCLSMSVCILFVALGIKWTYNKIQRIKN